MLFYGRYVREDPYAIFSGVLMLYAVLRYLEEGERKYLYVLAVTLAAALPRQGDLLHLRGRAPDLPGSLLRRPRHAPTPGRTRSPIRGFVIALVARHPADLPSERASAILEPETATLGATEVASPANPLGHHLPTGQGPARGACAGDAVGRCGGCPGPRGCRLLSGARLHAGSASRSERSFDLLILAGTLVLPMLVAVLLKLPRGLAARPDPHDDRRGAKRSRRATCMIVGAFLAVAFGYQHCRGAVVAPGLVEDRAGVLGAVHRLLHDDLHEYRWLLHGRGWLAGLLAGAAGRAARQSALVLLHPDHAARSTSSCRCSGAIAALMHRARDDRSAPRTDQRRPMRLAADCGSTTSELRNTCQPPRVVDRRQLRGLQLAGEKMPWLTYHLAWPLILFAGWGIGWLIDTTDWQQLRERNVAAGAGRGRSCFLTSLAACTDRPAGRQLPHSRARTWRSFRPLPHSCCRLSWPSRAALAWLYLLREWSGAARPCRWR